MGNLEEQGFVIRFWGVRGSYPTPGPHTLRHGGNTACVEICVGGQRLILDAGSGIIGLGSSLMQQMAETEPLDVSLLLTHAHNDHLQGFPFFNPLFDQRTHMHVFGPQLAGKTVEELIAPVMSPPYFPVDIHRLPSRLEYHIVSDAQCICWQHGDSTPQIVTDYAALPEQGAGEVRVYTNFTHSHPLNGAVIYRIEYAGRSVVYATDVEWNNGYESSFLRFAEGTDVLIHDAQYTTHDYRQSKHGFGHSTVTMATGVATTAGVGELILFHHEPTYNDDQLDHMEAQARSYFAHTRSACEGMEIDLLASLKE